MGRPWKGDATSLWLEAQRCQNPTFFLTFSRRHIIQRTFVLPVFRTRKVWGSAVYLSENAHFSVLVKNKTVLETYRHQHPNNTSYQLGHR